MSDDILRYDLMIEAALRDVVRETIEIVAQNGLPGEHHFYITFITRTPGVSIPAYLRKQYPDEMTIVLQYQFSDLKLEEDALHVTLSFNNVREKLVVPIEAITAFADPSVNFALQFQNSAAEQEKIEKTDAPVLEGSDTKEKEGKEEKRGEVISLDKFRKK